MIVLPKAHMKKIKEQINRPPLTDNYDRINFKSRNIFSKIKDLPNHKNKKITKNIRKIIRDKVRV